MSGSVSQIENNAVSAPNSGNKIVFLENVAGSSSYTATSISGFIVKQSVGIMLDKQYVTTPNGFHAYLNVSGRVVSEELSE